MFILWGLGLLVSVFVIALVVLAFVPTSFTVRREIIINRPTHEVFDYLRNLKNQPAFSMWSQLDPAMEKSFRGTDGTAGSIYAWSSQEKNVGMGELEVKALEANRRIELEIRFTKPFVSADPTVIEFEALDPARTRVMQAYFGKMPYPMNVLCRTISKTIGEGMDTSFQSLKLILEGHAPSTNVGHP